MENTTSTTLAIRLPASLLAALEKEADEKGCTPSELTRAALRAHLKLDAALDRHVQIYFELAKTRQMFLRFMDTQMDPTEVDDLITRAEADAAKYILNRFGVEG